jgi:hypothetical protein
MATTMATAQNTPDNSITTTRTKGNTPTHVSPPPPWHRPPPA